MDGVLDGDCVDAQDQAGKESKYKSESEEFVILLAFFIGEVN